MKKLLNTDITTVCINIFNVACNRNMPIIMKKLLNTDITTVCINIFNVACNKIIIDSRCVISNNVVCATSKASDQPTHTHSLIRAFASRLNILWVLSY